MEILSNNRNCPPEVVCFHCQQFVEKLLKALLTLNNTEAPKTHDLRRLIELAKAFVPELIPLSEMSDKLTFHGVETRYPGDSYPVSRTDMDEIIAISEEFGDILLKKLSL